MDLTGKRFGRWTAIKKDPENNRKWICKCDCGNIKSVFVTNLTSGKTLSCGCKIREVTTERNTSHGKTKTRLYTVWQNMIRRCRDPKNNRYMNYGGRGIKVCDAWNDFQTFYEWAMQNGYDETAEYGKCTIDRIDVNKGYEPSNCTWTDIKHQCNNRTSNVLLSFNGKIQNITQWENELGFPKDRLANRLRKGWTVEKALLTPLKTR